MQCPSCEFFNMPGAGSCGRCGSTLQANSVVVNVEPPRASSWSKLGRRLLPGRTAYRMRDEWQQLRRQASQSVERTGFDMPDGGTLLRMIVPGWALQHRGDTMRGRAFLGGYCVLMLVALVCYGGMLGTSALGTAFGVHVGSNLSVLRWSGATTMGQRVGMSAMLAGALLALIYLPAGFLASRYAMPFWLNYPAVPFEAGDVLVMNPSAYGGAMPSAGDVVLFTILQGQFIDRVLAVGGDEVRWKDGAITVNGQVSPHLPLNPAVMPRTMKWSVPAGYCLILPTTGNPAQWQQLGAVRTENIIGKVYFRTQPLSRWGRIR